VVISAKVQIIAQSWHQILIFGRFGITEVENQQHRICKRNWYRTHKSNGINGVIEDLLRTECLFMVIDAWRDIAYINK